MNTRDNPQYAALARRKAIIGDLVTHLTTNYTTSYGDNPQKHIIAEELAMVDAEVPEEEIKYYISELEQEGESLRLELAKFEFVRRTNDGQQSKENGEARSQAPVQKKRKARAAGR